MLARAALGDGGGAFTAVVSGEVAVDLWTGWADEGRAWQQDTVSCAYSASKGAVTCCLVLLRHEGLLDLDAPVASYWPEFAAAGKSAVTVRQLLSHSAGLPAIPDYQGFLGIYGENWDQLEEIRSRLAASAPAWTPGTAHGYHGLSFGYLAGGLVERVSGLPMPAFLHSRLAQPWGLDLRFGVTPETDGRRARQLAAAPLSPELEATAEPLRAMARDPQSLLGKAFLAQDGTTVLEHLDAAGTDPACMNVGAGNGDIIASARGLASLYEHMSGGDLRDSLLAFGETHLRGPDLVLGVPATWCVGFQGNDVSVAGGLAMGPGTRTFGHHGAVGFVRNQLSAMGTVARDLITAVTLAEDR